MQPKEVRELQAALEDVQDSLTRLLAANANAALAKANGILKGSVKAIVKAAPADKAEQAQGYLDSILSEVKSTKELLAEGNVQAALGAQGRALTTLSSLEELIASTYVQPAPPSEYRGLPYLKGRAVVEFTLKRDGEKFDVDGTLYDKLDMQMIVDGYTAPLTAGNFIDLVQRGFYNGMHIQRSDGFVVQTGDPSAEGNGKAHGFTPPGESKERKIPLEVYVRGDKSPIYGTTFDDDGRGGYASTLPFNAYGALGMAREEYDVDSASSQWFWLLFDSDLTPAGKNLLDGRYSCFGYTVEGARFLSDVKEGDIIASAKVVSGLDNILTVGSS